MKELMIHIEKAVRPLRLPQGLRRKMREELLDHLQQIYREELEKRGDEHAAVVAAIERFGPAEELCDKLRESLPWYAGALSYVPLFAPVRHWPPTVSSTVMRGWATGVLFWIFVGVPWCTMLVSTGRLDVEKAIGLWLLLAGYGLAIFVTFLGIVGSLHGVYGLTKSARRAALFGVGGACAMAAVQLMLKWFVKPTMPISAVAISALLPLGFLAMSQSRWFARAVEADEQRGARTGEWERLELAND